VVDAAARAGAFTVHRMLAGTFDTFRALHDNLAAVIEAVAGALAFGAACLDTVEVIKLLIWDTSITIASAWPKRRVFSSDEP
jgi:hypothetical protein